MRAHQPTVRRVAMMIVAVLALPACAVARVDAPIVFGADRRLKIVAPKPDADVTLPVTVRWTVKDFPLVNGNHFGVFVDKVVVPPKELVRLKVCTIGDEVNARTCVDDRDVVLFTTATSMTFKCFKPKRLATKRQKYIHSVSVVLLDGSNRRVGQAAYTINFEIDERGDRRCRGL